MIKKVKSKEKRVKRKEEKRCTDNGERNTDGKTVKGKKGKTGV